MARAGVREIDATSHPLAPTGNMRGVIDTRSLWDFAEPAGSEQRLRAAAAEAAKGVDREVWLTQVARALGVQEKYAGGHEVLDTLDATDPEVRARVALERGRLVRSAGDGPASRPHFEEAATTAAAAGLEELQVDAMHMVAMVAGPADQVALTLEALGVARAASDPRARDWDASLLNNLGMTHADSGDHVAALAAFEEALDARERIGDIARIRVARWMVAWSLRHLGHHAEALALQRSLRADLAADGEVDPYVDEEIGLLEGLSGPA